MKLSILREIDYDENRARRFKFVKRMGRACAASMCDRRIHPQPGCWNIAHWKLEASCARQEPWTPLSHPLLSSSQNSLLPFRTPYLARCSGSNNKHESTFAAFSRKHETSRSGFEAACGSRGNSHALARPLQPLSTQKNHPLARRARTPPHCYVSRPTYARYTRVVGCVSSNLRVWVFAKSSLRIRVNVIIHFRVDGTRGGGRTGGCRAAGWQVLQEAWTNTRVTACFLINKRWEECWAKLRVIFTVYS